MRFLILFPLSVTRWLEIYIRKRGDKVHLFPPITTLNVGQDLTDLYIHSIASCNILFKCLAVKVEERTLVNFRSDEWKWKLLEKGFFRAPNKRVKRSVRCVLACFLDAENKAFICCESLYAQKKSCSQEEERGEKTCDVKRLSLSLSKLLFLLFESGNMRAISRA